MHLLFHLVFLLPILLDRSAIRSFVQASGFPMEGKDAARSRILRESFLTVMGRKAQRVYGRRRSGAATLTHTSGEKCTTGGLAGERRPAASVRVCSDSTTFAVCKRQG